MPKSEGGFKEFRLGDLFEIKGVKQSKCQKDIPTDTNGIPYIVQSTANNMFSRNVNRQWLIDNNEPPQKGNAIVLGVTLPAVSYQPIEFGASQVITARSKQLNEYVGIYFATIISKHMARFSYQEKPGIQKYKDLRVTLPVTKSLQVDYAYMERFIREIASDHQVLLDKFLFENGYSDYSLTGEERQALSDLAKGTIQMKRTKIVDVFNVANTHNILKSDVVFGSGIVPYVTASENDNSVTSYISYNDELKESGNTIMIGGKTLVITYQPRDFFSNDSHNLTLTINNERGKTESAQLFMVASLYKSLKPIYSWGNSISKAKIQKDYVDLPVSTNGSIDYAFMETYINALKKQCIAKLKVSNVFSNSRIATMQSEQADEVEEYSTIVLDTSEVSDTDRFTRFLPLYDIAIACGAMIDEGVQSLGKNDVEMEGWIDVSEHIRKPNDQMFIVRAKGESMLPKIHPGDLCVFEVYGGSGNAGSREGQIVLARQSRKDNDYNCQYTIKQYHSEKDPITNLNTKIELRPLNKDGYDPIIINPEDDGEVKVLGVLKDVINL